MKGKTLGVLGAIGSVVVMLVAMAFGKVAGRAAVDAIYEPDLDKVLVETASKMNATLPMMVDKETRLDTTLGGPGKEFTYFYTLPAYASKDLDPAAVQRAIEPLVRSSVCGNQDMKSMFKVGVTARYIYRANDNVEVARLSITPADCGVTPELR
ncbi:hypothetical protein [Pseudoxanthomonas mexicana]